MSQLLIQKYLNELAKLRQVSGTHRESVVREAFKDLLKNWARSHDLTFIPEYELETKAKDRRYVDGALVHTLRVPFGYWEAKDEKDDLDEEIETKFRRGYPKTNIIFEDSTKAVLIQHSEEVMRCDVDNVEQLEKLLKLFFGYERPEIEAFRKAVEQFKVDLPAVLEALRLMIEKAHKGEPKFRKAAVEFLKHAQDAINKSLTDADVREMLIQHILTGEIFAAVFPGQPFHEDNNIACELHKLEDTFFTGNTKHQTLKGLAPYYTAIRKAATEISTHHEKQTFLKSIYENFYKVYNPKAADRLGVVYTPNEIVRFMIESADWLCEQHFRRNLIDKDVDILDPATGTGTFICELIEHFAGQPEKLKHKYQKELHANEVAILPYYVANLNIEATYAAATGGYEEFPGLCFVDTLDNTSALRKHRGHMDDLFGSVSDENIGRIKRQNSKTISVIIGNPPYNSNQPNENDNNTNREYPEIDKRIKETYIDRSSATKTKRYDMYSRFYRWASDRIAEQGIIAFITNRNFLDAKEADGFRRCIEEEFNATYIVDLGGDLRQDAIEAKANVFGIKIGVAICFLVRDDRQKKSRQVRYVRVREPTRDQRLALLSKVMLSELAMESISLDDQGRWLGGFGGDFGGSLTLVPAKGSKKNPRSIMMASALGVSTNRDSWLIDFETEHLLKKVRVLSQHYEASSDGYDPAIKWSETLKRHRSAGKTEPLNPAQVKILAYRPFCTRVIYDSELFIDRRGVLRSFEPDKPAKSWFIAISTGGRSDFSAIATSTPASLDFFVPSAAVVIEFCGGELDSQPNAGVTDWALDKFRKHYQPGRGKKDRPVTKEAIFHYVYGVLHNPAYREKYALNLKREFPRIPFYDDFWQWADWGKALMDLHIGYESVEQFRLKRTDTPPPSPPPQAGEGRKKGKRGEGAVTPKAMLKADRDAGTIRLDSETVLSGIPSEAWDYKLGNRSALEWVLDQYKEKTPKDPTIREKFNTYRFADYKEKVIELLARVTTVSIETTRIVQAMRLAND
ncbi:MAG: type ISP restriction/modification enzyme [Nevskiales bacterium]